MSEPVGSVARLWRFPVKSMRGERLHTAELTNRGVALDRAYALVDCDSGQVLSAKRARVGATLLRCRATVPATAGQGEDPAPVLITLPDGTAVRADAPDAVSALADFLHHPVQLRRTAPEQASIRRTRSSFLADTGFEGAVPDNALFDLLPISILTTSTLARLGQLRPTSRFDDRRFRMNIIVRTAAAGFVENGWTGRRLRIGGDVCLRLALPAPRCALTTVAQEDLPEDREILRTVARHNRLQLAGRAHPCAGVYAAVESAGRIREGDEVRLD